VPCRQLWVHGFVPPRLARGPRNGMGFRSRSRPGGPLDAWPMAAAFIFATGASPRAWAAGRSTLPERSARAGRSLDVGRSGAHLAGFHQLAQGYRNGEDQHRADQARLERRHWVFLRHEEERPHADRQARAEEIRSGRAPARGIQGSQDQVAGSAASSRAGQSDTVPAGPLRLHAAPRRSRRGSKAPERPGQSRPPRPADSRHHRNGLPSRVPAQELRTRREATRGSEAGSFHVHVQTTSVSMKKRLQNRVTCTASGLQVTGTA
jgi:hypothetical protein